MESGVIESASADGPIPVINREAIEGTLFKLLSNEYVSTDNVQLLEKFLKFHWL